MTTFLTWLFGTKLGRWLAVFGTAIGVAGLLALKLFGMGEAAAKAKQQEASVKALRTRNGIEDDIGKMSDDELDASNARWVRRDDANNQ